MTTSQEVKLQNPEDAAENSTSGGQVMSVERIWDLEDRAQCPCWL